VKKILTTAMLASTLAATPAAATVFGQFTSAETLPLNEHLFGAYLNASDSVFGLLGQLRLSFYPGIDFGFQGGLNRIDTQSSTRTTVRLGGDLNVAVMRHDSTHPLDLALGGAIGIETGDDYSTLTIGPSAVISRTFPSGANSSIVPYAGMMIAFTTLNTSGLDQNDLSIPIRLGAELRFVPGARICAELQLRPGDEINDDVGFAVGVNLPF
jgi:hypothetical protein